MSDRILIQDLFLRAIIGVNPDERDKVQDLLLNVTLEVDTRPAAATDHIDQAVNYATVTKRIVALVEGSRYQLLESLAEAVAHACLEDPRVRAVTVRVDKPRALRYARSVAIEIYRTRKGG